MQQTILALGALMIIMITALNHQRSVLMIQEASYAREMESAALDIAKLKIEEKLIQTEFDDRWTTQTVFPSSATELTPAASLGPDPGETPATYNDIDDYHNFTETNVLHSIGADTFRFNITYTVKYVDLATNDTTSTQTYIKKITAKVVSVDSVGARVARAVFDKNTDISEDL
jgi:hypothetical protein